MKKLIKNIFDKLGFEIRRKPSEKEIKYLSFDNIYQKIIKNDKPIIFDVGANKGQSIDRFLKIRKFDTRTISYIEKDDCFYNYPLQYDDLPLMPDYEQIKKELSEAKDGELNFDNF